MSPRLRKFGRWAGYAFFYLFCLGLFGYLTFPFDRLKDRIIAEFDRQQAKASRRGRGGPMQLEIGGIESYWFSGIELSDVRLTVPPAPPKLGVSKSSPMAFGAKKASDTPEKPMTIVADAVIARLQLLPLLAGNLRLKFEAKVFGGTIRGAAPLGRDNGGLEIQLEGIQLGDIKPLSAKLEGLPIVGQVDGKIDLTPKEGKFAKADGAVAITLANVIIGNGKKKVQGLALPAAQLGTLEIQGTAKDGLLTIEELGGAGKALTLSGDGKLKLNDKWDRCNADITLTFKFSDSYRDSSDATRSLLGKPGDKLGPLIELDRKVKQAKLEEATYRFHMGGALKRLKFEPKGTGASSRGLRKGRSGLRIPRSTKAMTPKLRVGGGAPPFGKSKKDEEKKEDEERE